MTCSVDDVISEVKSFNLQLLCFVQVSLISTYYFQRLTEGSRKVKNMLFHNQVLLCATACSAMHVLAIVIRSVHLSVCVTYGTDSSPAEIETPCFHRMIA